MERLTSKRVNGIKSGYWSAAKKDELIARLAEYEDTGKTPEEIRGFEETARKMVERTISLHRELKAEQSKDEWIPVCEKTAGAGKVGSGNSKTSPLDQRLQRGICSR